MLKRHTFWLWAAVVLLFLTGAIHSVSLFLSPTPQNETERQMLFLMMSYKEHMGAGFHPTMWNLLTALSSCFSLLCLLGGLTIAFLLKRNAPSGILKGIVGIHLLIFTVCFVIDAFLTFLAPIVLTGLCVLFLIGGFLTIPKATFSEQLN